MPFITVLQNAENARVVAAIQRSISRVTTVVIEFLSRVFIFAISIVFAITKTDPTRFISNTQLKKSMNVGA